MAGLGQYASLPRHVSIENTFINFVELELDEEAMMSCPLAHFASEEGAPDALRRTTSGSTSESKSESGSDSPRRQLSGELQSFLLNMSTPTGSKSLSFLTAFSRELKQTPCKVGSSDAVLPHSSFRIKNTFVESDEQEATNEDRYGVKTCPLLQFHSALFLSQDLSPMKVELPDDFLDPVSVKAVEQNSEESTSVGSESDTELEQLSADVGKTDSAFQSGPFSTGSAFHEAGTCEPCSWFWKSDGCRWGQNCVRCHLCPEGEVKLRKKQKVAAARARAARAVH